MATTARKAIYILIIALLAPWLYDRYIALPIMLGNQPGKLTPVYNIKSHDVKFRNRIRNCEDVLLNEAMGAAIFSCDPGRDRWNTVMGTFHPEKGLESGKLWLYEYAKEGLEEQKRLKPLTFKNFPNENDFHPLGIELDPDGSTLYAVNHAQSGSCVEVFKLSVQGSTLTHVQTFKHPLIHAPNSIAALGDGKLFITNDHYMRAAVSSLLSKIETFASPPLATVVYTDLRQPENTKIVARVPFANGVAMLNTTTLSVASSSKPAVYFFDVQPGYSLTFKEMVRVPAAVDNLSVDSSGALLLAGHPSALAIVKLSKARPNCNPTSEVEVERQACECNAPSWIGEWTEEQGLSTLYMGLDFCSSTMAVRDRKKGVGIVSGLYERGFMEFSE